MWVKAVLISPRCGWRYAAKPFLPVVLLHGFDSSLLEFRTLLPLLDAAGVPAWAVDLVGWGFTDAGFHANPDLRVGPQQKRDHLYAFWKEKVRLARRVPKPYRILSRILKP